MGRPTGFTKEIADEICERIADGQSLRSICDSEDMPNKATVFRWLGEHQAFRDQYAHAREAQADALVDEMLDIADDARNDWMERLGDDGSAIGWRENGETARRSALRLDARKWVAAKLRPKKYGDKLDLNVSGKLETLPQEQLDARLAELLGKAGISVPAPGSRPKEADE